MFPFLRLRQLAGHFKDGIGLDVTKGSASIRAGEQTVTVGDGGHGRRIMPNRVGIIIADC